MKYRVHKTSDMCGKSPQPCSSAYIGDRDRWGTDLWFVNLNTLEDLHELIKEVGHSVIVSDGEIEIYDDYRE